MKISRLNFIALLSLFFVLFYNGTFFIKVSTVYPLTWNNIGFLVSLGVVLMGVITILLLLTTHRYTLKPIAIALLMISSFTSYFMQTYNVILDETMIQNTMETNLNESLDLLTWKLLGYVVFLGLLPSWVVYRTTIDYKSFKGEFLATLKGIMVIVGISGVLLFSFSKHYTSFFRENKSLRFYTNPTYYLYSTGKYIYEMYFTHQATLQPFGRDAKRMPSDTKRLTIVVVGEAARANRFSLNG